jgi:hypothetical protein
MGGRRSGSIREEFHDVVSGLQMISTRRGVLTAGAALAAMPRATLAAANPPHVLPFRFADNQATVAVYIGAEGPFRFLIDSGAIHVAMAGPQLAALGLPVSGTEAILGASGRFETQIYQAAKIKVGDNLTLTDVGIRGLNIGEAVNTNSAVGILPLHIFGQSITDFARHTVTVQGQPAGPPSGMMVFPGSAPIAPEQRPRRPRPAAVADPRPYATAGLQDSAIRVLIDTGYSGALILTSKYVRESGLIDRYGKGRLQTLVGATGPVVASMMQAESLGFGGHIFKDQWIELSDPELTIPAAAADYDGVIGVELLRRFDLWTDGRTGAVGVRPNALIDDMERYDRSGLDIAPGPDGLPGLVVTHISSGSPADKAGLKVGDRILSFGEGGADLYELRWALSGAPGTAVELKIGRPDGETTVRIVLAG